MSYTIGHDRNDKVRKLYDQWPELLPITLTEFYLLREFRQLEDMIDAGDVSDEQIKLQAELCHQIIDRRRWRLP